MATKPKQLKPKSADANQQSAEDFDILEGLDGIRNNATMYMGELGENMAYRAIKEPVDNSYDEALAKRNKLIEVVLNLDSNFYIVADGAGGIPVEMKVLKDKTKISTLTAAFTRVHAGGKFNDKSYKVSAGTHGVGVAALNAVSEKLQVWTRRSGVLYTQSFAKGEIVGSETPTKVKAIPPETAKYLVDDQKVYGTVIHYVLDQSVVSADAMRDKRKQAKNLTVAQPDPKKVATWLATMADLNPGLKIRLTLIRGKKTINREYLNKDTLEAYVKKLVAKSELGSFGKPLVFKTDYITVACQWTTHELDDRFETFVNNSPTADGGTHVRGFLDALADSIRPYEGANDRKAAKGSGRKTAQYDRKDLLTGLLGAFDWRMHGAQYSSQVKDKLTSNVTQEVYTALKPVFDEYFASNKTVAKTILMRARELNKGREALAKTMRSLGDAKRAGSGSLPAELTQSKCKDPTKVELYTVEGDSASGSCKDARNPDYQEIFKCKGKPVNALTATIDKVLGNAVIQGLIASIGLDLKTLDVKEASPKFDCTKLRIGKLLLCSDADHDGFHINALILAFIYRFAPDMFKRGMIYIVDAPLYNVIYKGKHYGAPTLNEVLEKTPKGVTASMVQRAKGWGEVSPELLSIIAFDPNVRKLIKLDPFESVESERWFRRLVGDDASARRQLLGMSEAA